jgi:hypothetical protein
MGVPTVIYPTVSTLVSNNKNKPIPQMKRVWVFHPSNDMSNSQIARVEAWQGSKGFEWLGIYYKSGHESSSNGYDTVIKGLYALNGENNTSSNIDDVVKLIAETQAIICSDPDPTMLLVYC